MQKDFFFFWNHCYIWNLNTYGGQLTTGTITQTSFLLSYFPSLTVLGKRNFLVHPHHLDYVTIKFTINKKAKRWTIDVHSICGWDKNGKCIKGPLECLSHILISFSLGTIIIIFRLQIDKLHHCGREFHSQ